VNRTTRRLLAAACAATCVAAPHAPTVHATTGSDSGIPDVVAEALAETGDNNIVIVSTAPDGTVDVAAVNPDKTDAYLDKLAEQGADVIAADRDTLFSVTDNSTPPDDIGTGSGDAVDGNYRSMYRWAYETVRSSGAWPMSTGVGVVVAVIDTGVDTLHNDFGGRVLPGVTILDGKQTVGTTDTYGHGTHVAGIIAATPGNKIGTDGSAPGATILPVRTLGNDGYGKLSDIAAGIVYAVDQGADIINLSLSGPATAAGDAALAYATTRGVLVVGAVGNSGPAVKPGWPASNPSVIGVGSVDPDLNISSFSQTGNEVDFVAPGRNINSLAAGGGSIFMSGTSMATPHVAGALAVLLALTNGDSAAALAALANTATDLGTSGRDRIYGDGLIDITAAAGHLTPGRATTTYVPYGPTRLLDTRDNGKLVPAGTTTVIKAPADISAAGLGLGALALNVTVTETAGPGYVTIWACGNPQPFVSNGNYPAQATRATATIAPVAADGTVCIYNLAGTHLVVDLTGWYPQGQGFTADAPKRLYDTRSTQFRIPAGETVGLNVVERGNLPEDVAAVSMTVTVTDPISAGYVTVYQCGNPVPLASNVNFTAGETVANNVLVAPDTYGTICLYTSTTTHIVFDLNGWTTTAGTGRARTPTRVLDTREPDTAGTGQNQNTTGGLIQPGAVLTVDVKGNSTPRGVFLNAAVTQPAGGGYVTIWPCDQPKPATSTLNYMTGQTTANSAIVPVSATGQICASVSTPAHLVIDAGGRFGP
jgi:subtilisin family serine protease